MLQDKLGNPLELNMYVAFAANNSLHLGQVSKITPKMIRVSSIKNSNSWLRYANDVVIIENARMTYYILQNS